MPGNKNLHRAKKAKNDEFYTQYADIEKEMNAYLEYDPDVFRDKTILLPCDDPEWSNFTKYFAQNFDRFGIKKLISTSYAADSKPDDIAYQPTLFEMDSPKYDEKKTRSHGKIFILERDKNKDKKIDINDLEWNYLKGDGDFRSEEIKKLRNEADIVVTNPPFSLFREFLAWIVEAQKQFIIIGNQNVITCKDIFPLIKRNRMWFGNHSGHTLFAVPDSASIPDFYDPNDKQRLNSNGYKIINGKLWRNLGNICWFTNVDHGRRHQPLSLMTMADNLRYNNFVKNIGYRKYDEYDAIEIPQWTAIPSDYVGMMGVPISFLDKFCPEQFEIIWLDGPDQTKWYGSGPLLNGRKVYRRIFIKHKEAK